MALTVAERLRLFILYDWWLGRDDAFYKVAVVISIDDCTRLRSLLRKILISFRRKLLLRQKIQMVTIRSLLHDIS